MLCLLPGNECLEVNKPLLSSPGWHWEEALIAPIVRSAFLIIVPYKEVPAPERAGVLDAGLWEPRGKKRQGKTAEVGGCCVSCMG